MCGEIVMSKSKAHYFAHFFSIKKFKKISLFSMCFIFYVVEYKKSSQIYIFFKKYLSQKVYSELGKNLILN